MRRGHGAAAPAAQRPDDRREMNPAVPAAPAPPPDPRVLFRAGPWQARELAPGDVGALQALFDANPEYFLAVNGRRAAPDEAQTEFDELPPPHLRFARRWLLGLYGENDELVGVASLLSDFVAVGLWHLALFLVATRLHGSGAAALLHTALEEWMRAQGARWLRLGVVAGNARAERFWTRQGYREVRQRNGVDTGGRLNDLRVLVKPMAGDPIEAYFVLAPRDHPASTLP